MELLRVNLTELKDNVQTLVENNQFVVGLALGFTCYKLTTSLLLPLVKNPLDYYLSHNKLNPKDTKYSKEKFYLHICPRKCTKQVPNLSPFAVKVETWLRLRNIQYEAVETVRLSNSTSQIPYLFHNGQEIADSDFIIEYIEDVLELDKSEGLDKEQIGSARAFIQMVEESTAWTYFIHRYAFDLMNYLKIYHMPIPEVLAYFMKRQMPGMFITRMKDRGIGRKSPSEIYRIGNGDIKAISNFLNDKKYMMGDKMTKVDCAVFGQLSQIVYVDFQYPHMDFIRENCANLMPYMDRVKAACWPDWDDVAEQGHFF